MTLSLNTLLKYYLCIISLFVYFNIINFYYGLFLISLLFSINLTYYCLNFIDTTQNKYDEMFR